MRAWGCYGHSNRLIFVLNGHRRVTMCPSGGPDCLTLLVSPPITTPWCRFFPCPEADCYDFKSSQQLRQELGPDQIAGLQQGTTAWHQARSRHITGSRIGDLLGFNLPRPNRVLVNYGVYHTVNDSRQGHQQLLSATAALRGGQATAAAAAELGAFGTLCCAWGCK